MSDNFDARPLLTIGNTGQGRGAEQTAIDIEVVAFFEITPRSQYFPLASSFGAAYFAPRLRGASLLVETI